MNILITGSAGFIGYHLVLKLSKKYKNTKIYGIDSLNNYYNKKLKRDRIINLKKNLKKRFIFKKINISDQKKSINCLKIKDFTL